MPLAGRPTEPDFHPKWRLFPTNGDLVLLAEFDDAVGGTDAAPENVRIEDGIAADDRARIQHGIAADIAAVADDRAELAQPRVDIVAVFDGDVALDRFDVRENRARAEMRLVPKDGIADVTEMRDLGIVEENGVLEFARVAEHALISHDDVPANVGAGANLAVLADDGRALDRGAVLDDGTLPDEHIVRDVRRAENRAQSRRLEPLLQEGWQFLQRIPHGLDRKSTRLN